MATHHAGRETSSNLHRAKARIDTPAGWANAGRMAQDTPLHRGAALLPGAALEHAVIREAASRALGEDCAMGDITSMATVPSDRIARARLFTREACVLAGLPLAEAVFQQCDPAMEIQPTADDGAPLSFGDTILELTGNARAILTGERTALNFLQQLSSTATTTRAFVDAVAGTTCRVLDTRKTIPGLRALQKYAVRCGGGTNHRIGLYDAFLIKDNHLALMGEPGNWAAAIASARALDPDAKLEVEADTLEQVRAIADLGVDVLLLDNMSNEQMREAVDIVAGRCLLEASGNMSLERAPGVAATGVDFISVGALTHTIRAVDMSLEML